MPRGRPKGGKKAGGRQKGTPNKTTANVKAALLEAFDLMGGIPALSEWGKDNPTEFYALWGKLIPQEVKNADGEAFKVVQVTEVVVSTRAEADAVLKLNSKS